MRSGTKLCHPSSGLSVATRRPSVEDVLHQVIAVGVAYEVTAWASRSRLPTLSELCREHRWFEGLLLGWLILEFHYEKRVLLPD